MQGEDTQLRRFLLDAGLVTRKDIDAGTRIADERDISLQDALIVHGSLTDDDARRVTAHAEGVPYVSLRDRRVPREILTLLPEPVARTHGAIPYAQNADTLDVALLDLATFDAVQPHLRARGLRVRPHITDRASFNDLLLRYQEMLHDTYGTVFQNALAAETPDATTLLDALLHHAHSAHARDIHIESEDDSCRIRYRVHGLLYDALELAPQAGITLTERITEIAHVHTDSPFPQEGRFRISLEDDTHMSVRAVFLPTARGVRITLHLVPQHAHGFTLEGLGLHGEARERVMRALAHRDGMILVSGEVGSGVTTTLYTLLDQCQDTTRSITTIEHTVEALLPYAHQVVLRPDLGMTEATALRAAMRSDTDTLLIDVLDNTESTELALKIASRDTQVISSVAAPDAVSGLEALREYTPHSLAPVHVVISGALIRRLGESREKHYLTSTEVTKLRSYAHLTKVLKELKEDGVVAKNATWGSIPFFREKSDDESEETAVGYIGAFEVLEVTGEIRETLKRDIDAADILETACAHGMLTVVEDALYKAAMGITSLDEVWRLIDERYRS